MFKANPLLNIDSYKLAHRRMYPEGTNLVYSNFTPRSDKYFNVPDEYKPGGALVFGITGLIQEMLSAFNEGFFERSLHEVVTEYQDAVAPFCGLEPKDVEVDHIVALHRLRYLPVTIKALPEGTLCPVKVPMLTIRNTHRDFFWLTNYLETWLSSEGWKPCTSATLAFALRKVLDRWAAETGSPAEFVDWQGHDFSMRGMSGVHDAARTGAGHLTSFLGSDTIQAAQYLKEYYGATGLIAGSVPASEHSVMTMGGRDGEYEILDRTLFDVHPSGVVSVVSDSYDFFKVVTEYASSRKDRILSRGVNALGMGKVVFRPDSGDPVDILCGRYYQASFPIEEGQRVPATFKEAYLHSERMQHLFNPSEGTGYPRRPVRSPDGRYFGYDYNGDQQAFVEITPAPEHRGAVECLWDVFGGTTTEKGFKVLHERVGLIYGDSITVARADEICRRLADKGFASCNCVFGVGSYSYNYNTRDSLGFAMKATYGEVNGDPREIFKDPVTDAGKRSAQGLLRVDRDASGQLALYDGQTLDEEAEGELRVVCAAGRMVDTWLEQNTLDKIRERIKKQ